MMILPTGERLTIIQIGDANDDEPFFTEAIATAEMVMPSMADAQKFYRDVLGLTFSISFQVLGSLRLELSVPNALINQTIADGAQTGCWMISFLTNDMDKVLENCQCVGAEIASEPSEISRPFQGKVRTMIDPFGRR